MKKQEKRHYVQKNEDKMKADFSWKIMQARRQ